MRWFPGVLHVFAAAAVVVVPGLARGEVDPDEQYNLFDMPGPSGFPARAEWVSGASPNRPGLSYDYQPLDCNKAGLTGTGLSTTRTFELEVGSGINWDYINSVTGRNQYMLYPTINFGLSKWPSGGGYLGDVGADKGPIRGTFGGGISVTEMNEGIEQALEAWRNDSLGAGSASPLSDEINTAIDEALWNMHRNQFRFRSNSFNVETPIGTFPETLSGAVNQQYDLGGTTYTSLLFPEEYTGDVVLALHNAGIDFFGNGCWSVQLPSDPNFVRTGRHGGNSWGSKLDDQWAIKRVGLTGDIDSAWSSVPANAAPVVVAVIDTGLDWHHVDIDPSSIWRNEREVPDNGVDDDQNGYIDDIIGWDFLGKHNRPWDFDGHGTLVAGIIAAAHNDVGIAGINPNTRIMILKGVGNFGTTRPSFIAEAIVYAVDNGAKIINISVGGKYASRMVQAAVNHAHQQGVLVVAAAGNESVELDDYGPAGGENVLTVGATHDDNRGTGFANFGDKIDIAAPGVDVLSLRARFTDASYRPGEQDADEYQLGDHYVGDDKRYARASGTSFSAPIVAGIASLVMAKNPQLTGPEVGQVLMQTAADVDFPGRDKYTGNGMVDARAALNADAGFSITAEITDVRLLPAEAPSYVSVRGTIDAPKFKRAWVQIGPGENPGSWRYVGQKRKFPIKNGEIGRIPMTQFSGNKLWQVVVNVEDVNGVLKRAAYPIEMPW